jgi:hypothetical protein
VATCLATQAGCRSGSTITPNPTRTRSVTAATVARVTTLSGMGRTETRWSPTNTESRPDSSAARAPARTCPTLVAPGTPSITPTDRRLAESELGPAAPAGRTRG